MGFFNMPTYRKAAAVLTGGSSEAVRKLSDNDSNSVANNLLRSDLKGAVAASHSSKEKDAKDKATEMEGRENDQYNQNLEYNKQLAEQDDPYKKDLGDLQKQADDQIKDSRTTYSNEIQPRQRDMMEDAGRQRNSAMSLQDAMNPNNKVASGVRGMYDQQAQLEGRRGLAASGTMQAMGMHNLAGQMNGVPMTGGQMQAMMGANTAQAGNAYANTQQRMANLRDQGNAQAFARSDKAYDQGQQAIDRYGNAVNSYEQAGDRQRGREKDYRGESLGYSNQQHALSQEGITRNMAAYNQHMGGQQANTAGQISQINAGQSRDAQMQSGAMQAGGTVLGAYFGGPAGAKVGDEAGKQVATQNAPAQTATPRYGNYNNNQVQGPPAYAAGNGSGMPIPQDEGAGGMSLADNNNPYANYSFGHAQQPQGRQSSKGGRR